MKIWAHVIVKNEIGISFSSDFYYPEVLFRPRPNFVYSPWQTVRKSSIFKDLLLRPARYVKRRFSYGR